MTVIVVVSRVGIGIGRQNIGKGRQFLHWARLQIGFRPVRNVVWLPLAKRQVYRLGLL